MQETWVPSLGGEDPLEKGKATHSSILAWRIPRPIQSFSYTVGEGNGSPLQYSSLENPRDGGWATSLSLFPFMDWRRQRQPTPVLEPGKSQGWRLSDFTFTFPFHGLEKEMAAHSSVLAWRIPGTGEPGGLPYMGSHRVGHDWSDLAVTDTVREVTRVGHDWATFTFIILNICILVGVTCLCSIIY